MSFVGVPQYLVEENKAQKLIKELMASVKPETDIEIFKDGRFGVQREVPFDYHKINADEYFQEALYYEWQNMYHVATKEIARLLMGNDYYFVTKMVPEIWESSDYGRPSILLRLYVFLTIAQTENVRVHTWVWDNNEIVEWRCGYCNSPNEIEQRMCIQCGAPRALLVQEMMCLHCRSPRDEYARSCSQCGGEYV